MDQNKTSKNCTAAGCDNEAAQGGVPPEGQEAGVNALPAQSATAENTPAQSDAGDTREGGTNGGDEGRASGDAPAADIAAPAGENAAAGELKSAQPPKRKRGWIWNIVLIVIIALGLWSLFGISGEISDDGMTFGEAMSSINLPGALMLLAVILGVMIVDCLKFCVVNKAVIGRVRPGVAIKTSFLGKFYDGITPFSTVISNTLIPASLITFAFSKASAGSSALMTATILFLYIASIGFLFYIFTS